MNTELTTAAVERLTAQLGEALFNQPGLDLIEIANRCNARASSAGGPLLTDSPTYTPQEMAASFRAGQNTERMQGGTPSSQWAANNEPDPHRGQYDCERAALTLGHLTDDALANDVFLHGDQKPSAMALASGVFPAIAYLTAAKDRIRWLSRALVAATGKQQVGGLNLAGLIAVEEADAVNFVHPEYGPGIFFTEDCRIDLAGASKQQVGEAEWVRDDHDVEQGLIRNPKYVATEQVGGVQGDVLLSFAREAVEYFRERSDVVDGDYGSPSPNQEMTLLSEGESALIAARQPVDISEFREPVHYWLHAIAGYAKASTVFGPAACAAYAAKAEQAKRLLALIDGQAVQS